MMKLIRAIGRVFVNNTISDLQIMTILLRVHGKAGLMFFITIILIAGGLSASVE
ncbi:hypothetical protein O9992_09035 [Vibrio lentus]|nr:hypothetical protein [Vibrio lentus]